MLKTVVLLNIVVETVIHYQSEFWGKYDSIEMNTFFQHGHMYHCLMKFCRGKSSRNSCDLVFEFRVRVKKFPVLM